MGIIIWYGSVWRTPSGTSSRISRPHPFTIFNGPSPLQHHHKQANALNVGLHTIRMRLYRKYTGTRLLKVFTGFHEGKLGYRNLGTLALVQINSEDNCGMGTVTKPQERRCHDGSIDRD
jgi:hypothetical protein